MEFLAELRRCSRIAVIKGRISLGVYILGHKYICISIQLCSQSYQRRKKKKKQRPIFLYNFCRIGLAVPPLTFSSNQWTSDVIAVAAKITETSISAIFSQQRLPWHHVSGAWSRGP